MNKHSKTIPHLISSLKFRLHPVMIPFLFFLILTGDIASYALIFGSLLVHEMGHLIAAFWTGFKVRSCIIMPYGGELIITNRQKGRRSNQLTLIMGGPIATSILLFISMIVPIPEQSKLVTIQCVLLLINLLPILPLDGGQALAVLMSKRDNYQIVYEKLLVFSCLLSIGLMLSFIILLPEMLPIFIIMLFISFQNYQQWRFRKYRLVFDQLVNKQLTR